MFSLKVIEHSTRLRSCLWQVIDHFNLAKIGKAGASIINQQYLIKVQRAVLVMIKPFLIAPCPSILIKAMACTKE